MPDVRTVPSWFSPDLVYSTLTYFFDAASAIFPRQSKKANFDASHELEELLLEDNPLKARQRKVQDINNLTAEMRQMEEQ